MPARNADELIARQVIVSEFNKLDGNRYYDVESSTSFEFDHVTQVCPGPAARESERLQRSTTANNHIFENRPHPTPNPRL